MRHFLSPHFFVLCQWLSMTPPTYTGTFAALAQDVLDGSGAEFLLRPPPRLLTVPMATFIVSTGAHLRVS